MSTKSKHATLLAVSVSVFVALTSALSAADFPERPNIVFILVDDLGWQDVGYAGAEFFETPNIDKLAGQSMVFTDAYSSGPNCAPTRACIMTGAYTPRHKIYTPGGRAKGVVEYMKLLVPAREREDAALEKEAEGIIKTRTELPSQFVCIPEVLKPQGYVSARLGKWHLGEHDFQGFDISTSNGTDDGTGIFYGDIDVAETLTDRALSFMEENQDGPFFLYLAHWDVHGPNQAREAVVNKYRKKLEGNERFKRRNEKDSNQFNPNYAAQIDAVDTSVKRVVAKIDELGIAEKTLIVFSSDNGGTSVSQLKPYRSQKGSLFEAGVRVPAFVRWTGVITPGSQCREPITSVDYLPTFASLAGVTELPTVRPIDGVDISPLFLGKDITERSLFWHFPLYLRGPGLDIETPDGKYSWRGFPSTSIRQGDYKLIEFHEDDSVALYHLKQDPGEETSLAATMPELVQKLRRELDKWQKQTNAPISTTPNPEYFGNRASN